MVGELLKLHNIPLAIKNVLTRQDLVKIMRIDYEKICSALIELRTKKTLQILNEFFFENSETVPAILGSFKKRELSHVGFEIYEPLDLVLHGMGHAFNKLNQAFGVRFALRDVCRFPASQSFQSRVNAYVEIMRIRVELHGREIMLELFDIHRPVDIFSVDGKHRFSKRFADLLLVTSEEHSIDRDTRWNVFSRDKIWHYAIAVSSPEEVLRLHDYFTTFVVGRDAYRLPFENIVHNKSDGSFYSKIINTEKKIELEFVATQQ